MMLIVGFRWKIKKTIVALFIYRTVGQALFFMTGNDQFFFLFPNFLEPLFMIYAFLLFKYSSDQVQAHRSYKKHLLLIWFIIISYKMWNEYNIHIARQDLSQLFFGFNN